MDPVYPLGWSGLCNSLTDSPQGQLEVALKVLTGDRLVYDLCQVDYSVSILSS